MCRMILGNEIIITITMDRWVDIFAQSERASIRKISIKNILKKFKP